AFGGRLLDGTVVATVSRLDGAGWTEVAPMAVPRERAAVVVHDGSVLVLGGQDTTGPLSAVERYDPVTDTWQSLAPLPTARSGHGAVWDGSAVRVFGGGAGEDVLDPASGSWATRQAPVSFGGGWSGMAAVLGADGKIHGFGGQDDQGSTQAGHTWTPQTDGWVGQSLALFPESAPHLGASAAVLPTGQILVSGGLHDGAVHGEVHVLGVWAQARRDGDVWTVTVNGTTSFRPVLAHLDDASSWPVASHTDPEPVWTTTFSLPAQEGSHTLLLRGTHGYPVHLLLP
ncbi:MAG: hypothetical protein KC656_04455, partial [Myxococcales bacterium]|nr:hypothetical protein [Myxococcales bacterium]